MWYLQNVELGERIRELRTKNRLSQGDLAKAVEAATSTISEIERAERSPRVELLIKIADYFEVSLDFLLGRITEETTKEFAELKKEIDELKEDYEELNKGFKESIERIQKIDNANDLVPFELLMKAPELIIDENTQERLEAEYGVKISKGRLGDKYVKQILRFLLLLEKKKERETGGEEKDGAE
jgi:transcriptional regulator with XRE-family HTH domain